MYYPPGHEHGPAPARLRGRARAGEAPDEDPGGAASLDRGGDRGLRGAGTTGSSRSGQRSIVERDSQKGIVIGKGGETIKAVGTEAREEIEPLFGSRVFLDLRVKVEKDWQRRAHALERLGFTGS